MTNEIKSPKVIGCLVCGFRTEDENEIKEFQLNGCKCVARSKREWENNCCEGCFQPLRDCLCDEQFSCNACGEIAQSDEGTIELNQGYLEFTHLPELCPAQDEIEGE